MKKWFLKGEQAEKITNELYRIAVYQARQPIFYVEYGVPDTIDGRFDLIILHVHLLLRPLNKMAQNPSNTKKSTEARTRAQSLFDIMFNDMDRSLREMGVSDISIGKRIKQMVRAFYGRAVAYDKGLAGTEYDLQNALERNLYGTVKPNHGQLAVMADYLKHQAAHLAMASHQDVTEGNLQFAPWSRKIVDP